MGQVPEGYWLNGFEQLLPDCEFYNPVLGGEKLRGTIELARIHGEREDLCQLLEAALHASAILSFIRVRGGRHELETLLISLLKAITLDIKEALEAPNQVVQQ